MKIRCFITLSLFILSGITLPARAASSVLVWPIFQTIGYNGKGSELWLQNRGDSPVTLQLRVFKWQQRNSAAVYSDQHDVLASPPFVTVQPGGRQLVRMIRLNNPQPQTENAYRIVIDEIPGADDSTANRNKAGLIMRMRYVLPLFLYGQGIKPVSQNGPVTAVQQKLHWQILSEKGQNMLAIRNDGNLHARLSNIFWGRDSNHPAAYVAKGFMGYVLPGQRVLFPLPVSQPAGTALFSRLADNVAPVQLSPDR